MAAALREGYATSSTDTGHVGGTSAPLIGHPEKVIDYSHRAVHEMAATVEEADRGALRPAAAAVLLERLLDRGPSGADVRAALSRGLRRHPRRRAGQLPFAPAQQRSGQRRAGADDPRRAAAAGNANMLNQAVLNACDAQDGVKDGLLSNPTACKFDAATLSARARTPRAA